MRIIAPSVRASAVRRETAAGICRIVELQMADVIRKVTVEKGFDPRDFVLFAFGGAGRRTPACSRASWACEKS